MGRMGTSAWPLGLRSCPGELALAESEGFFSVSSFLAETRPMSAATTGAGTASQGEVPADRHLLALDWTEEPSWGMGDPPGLQGIGPLSVHKGYCSQRAGVSDSTGTVLVGSAQTSCPPPALPGCLRGGGAGVTGPGSLPTGPLGTCCVHRGGGHGDRRETARSSEPASGASASQPKSPGRLPRGPVSGQRNTAEAAGVHSCHCLPTRSTHLSSFS